MIFSRKKNKEEVAVAVEVNKNLPHSSAKKLQNTVPSIISQDLKIFGNLHSDGIVDIDGTVEGNVKCHTLTIRKNGHIKGDVYAENVFVYGRIQGQIKAKAVHFFKGCRAEGVIMHENITIEDGAFVDGRFKRLANWHLEADFLPESQAPHQREDEGALFSNAMLEDESYLYEGENVMIETDLSQFDESFSNSPIKGLRNQKDKDESVMDNLKLLGEQH